MATALRPLRRTSFEEEPVGRYRVYLWMDLEMNRIKKLEQQIEKLKDEIIELQRQMLALSLGQQKVIFVPQIDTQPTVAPPPPFAPPRYPYIGDPPFTPNGSSTITCGGDMQCTRNEAKAKPFLSAFRQSQSLSASN